MRRPPPSPQVLSVTLATAGMIAAAGWVHLRFGPEHMMESTSFGLAFYAMGVAQIAAAAALVATRGSTLSARVAVVLNLGIAGLWAVSRTVGLPIGPEAWHAEAAGAADVVCTVAEVWAAVAMVLLLPRVRAGRPALVAA
ncbi:MAG TPA: hypothetical protein VFJ85_06225 [Acidimicrobiales bacterium]|nr:hypothetical protein [Acidimicrobiales bacterium]